MKRRVIAAIGFTLAACGLYWLDAADIWEVKMSAERTLWQFLAIVCAVIASQKIAAIAIGRYVGWRGGTEGESKMLAGFVGVMAGLAVVGAFVYSLGMLKAVGVVAAGFAGMLLGWSLQAPVSGLAAWVMVTLKRPFRVGDRVLFPSLGLNGDVKQVGVMYTVLDQVGGAIGSEDAIGRDILIPNAMLFNQVAINYTPKAQAAFFLDEVVIRLTYDSDWDMAEKIMLSAANEVASDIIKKTGQKPYIRSDFWDYGILMRLRYMTMAKDRPRITHEIVKRIFKAVQKNPKVDMAIPFVYSYRRSMAGRAAQGGLFQPDDVAQEVAINDIQTDVEPSPPGEETMETDELRKSILEKGLLQPIILAPAGAGRFRIVTGQKRFSACKRLGWKSIPAIVQQHCGEPQA